MGTQLKFTIRKDRIDRARLSGFAADEAGTLSCAPKEDRHLFFPEMIDSGIEDCPWGRLCMEAELPERSVFYLYVLASDDPDCVSFGEDGTIGERARSVKRFLMEEGGTRFVNQTDVLLYEQNGRYLLLMLEVIGRGGGRIGNMQIFVPGDNFMQAFPEVYQEKNCFFHRFLSVFSSVYNDLQEKIDHMEELLDPARAPVRLLEFYAEWFGIDVAGGFLQEERLRRLIQEAPLLIQRKGTAFCIRRVSEIVIGERPVIVEKNRMREYIGERDRKICDRLFGESPYDVTLLYPYCPEEKETARLIYLLRQFMPARSRLRTVFLKRSGVLDGHCYLDVNAGFFLHERGRLDAMQMQNGMALLG